MKFKETLAQEDSLEPVNPNGFISVDQVADPNAPIPGEGVVFGTEAAMPSGSGAATETKDWNDAEEQPESWRDHPLVAGEVSSPAVAAPVEPTAAPDYEDVAVAVDRKSLLDKIKALFARADNEGWHTHAAKRERPKGGETVRGAENDIAA